MVNQAHEEEQKGRSGGQGAAMGNQKAYIKLDIEYEWIIAGLKSIITGRKEDRTLVDRVI